MNVAYYSKKQCHNYYTKAVIGEDFLNEHHYFFYVCNDTTNKRLFFLYVLENDYYQQI